jgi:hypothetical protein
VRARHNEPAPADLTPPPAVVCCAGPGGEGVQLMDVNDLAARGRRLDALARGLSRETARVRADTLTVLLYRERRGYLEAIHRALGGVEDARVVLARARHRLEG